MSKKRNPAINYAENERDVRAYRGQRNRRHRRAGQRREQDADFSKKLEQAAQEEGSFRTHPAARQLVPIPRRLSPKRDDAAAERVWSIDAANTAQQHPKAIKRVQRKRRQKQRPHACNSPKNGHAGAKDDPQIGEPPTAWTTKRGRYSEKESLDKRAHLTKPQGKTRLRFEEKEKPIPGGRQQHNPLPPRAGGRRFRPQ